jgi:hypothetical protein
VTEGTIGPTAWFFAPPKRGLKAPESLLGHRVLRMPHRERPIAEMVIRELIAWRNSGFSLHNVGRISAAGPPR